jgi:hypothetical protein
MAAPLALKHETDALKGFAQVAAGQIGRETHR